MIAREPLAIDIDSVMQQIRAELETPACGAVAPGAAASLGHNGSKPDEYVAKTSSVSFDRRAFRRVAGMRLIGFPIRVVHGIVRLPRILQMVIDAQAQIARLEFKNNEAIARFEYRLSGVISDAAKSANHLAAVSQSLDQAHIKLEDLWGNILDQQRRLDILLTEARRRLPEKLDQQQLQVFASEQDRHLQSWYASLEDRYRGTRRDVTERRRVYLPTIREAVDAVGGKPVLDMGCGRGEFLELLKEGGIPASGIDINPMMVARCRDLGLEVDEAEALTWLCSLPAKSLAGITGFHIIEHVPFPVLIRIFDECLRVLAPGGLVVFETPNPANLLVASERFYLDPTHINPLPSSTVSFVAEARGFTRVSILQLHPVANVERRVYDDPMLALLQEKIYGPQDYGLLAWKVK